MESLDRLLGLTHKKSRVDLPPHGPDSPMAEAEDLKSSQCGFDPHSGHGNLPGPRLVM